MRVGVDLRCLEEGELRGFARYTLQLVDRLARRSRLQLTGLATHPLPLEVPFGVSTFAAGREILAEQLQLPLLARRLGIDVLLSPANRGLPALSPCPTVLTLHDVVEWDPALVPARSGHSAFRFAYANVASLAGATLIVTVSHHSAASIVRRLGVDGRRLRMIHEAADERFFEHPGEDAVQRARQRYGIDPRSILYLGGFDRKKDVPTLIRALSRLDARTAPRLVLAGNLSGGSSEALELVRSLGLDARVTLPGFVEDADLPAVYRAASCFVFPGVAEGFGLPPLEAMASGLPAVVAAAGALPEVVADGGQTFPPGNDRVAAELIEGLTMSPALKERWSKAAVRRARSFTWDQTAERTEEVLTEAAAVSPARRLACTLRALRSARRWTS